MTAQKTTHKANHKTQEELVSGQFGSRAAAYLSSAVHALCDEFQSAGR